MRGESDASLRQIRGYIRVYKDPPGDPEATRQRMAEQIVSEFESLDEGLCKGQEIPEEWDRGLSHAYRSRLHSFPYRYVHRPGWDGESTPCVAAGKSCRWADAGKAVPMHLSVCMRCHTIRIRMEVEHEQTEDAR